MNSGLLLNGLISFGNSAGRVLPCFAPTSTPFSPVADISSISRKDEDSQTPSATPADLSFLPISSALGASHKQTRMTLLAKKRKTNGPNYP